MSEYIFRIEKDEDGILVGTVPSIPACYSQGTTLEELLQNMQEVLTLCIRNNSTLHTTVNGK